VGKVKSDNESTGAVFSLQTKNRGQPMATKVQVVSDDDNIAIPQQQQEHQRSRSGRETGDSIGCRRPNQVRSLETCGQRYWWLLGSSCWLLGLMELGLQSEKVAPARGSE